MLIMYAGFDIYIIKIAFSGLFKSIVHLSVSHILYGNWFTSLHNTNQQFSIVPLNAFNHFGHLK